ncbi:SDR family NAD(P)-dependent oxidoreductase [Actinoallomurus sp. CA-150999]|uniref:SDR family NAD(P)-dependent oxidoreductase n=1 Tax=Actinoallomurus sp. CA-150999 TaxID=3239887 RepID=UPI003D89E77B
MSSSSNGPAGRLAGKTAVITGTASGQGRAAAVLFAREGARVVGCDINPEGAAETVEMVTRAGGEMVSLHPCDLTDPGQAAAVVQLAISTFGGFEVLYNNAGMARMAAIGEMTWKDFSFTIDHEVNLIFHLVSAAWSHLIGRGGASIINTGSVSGSRVYKVLPGLAHSAAKGAVLSMTRQMAMEGGPHNLRANTLSPGLVEVPATSEAMKAAWFREPMLAKLMLPRWGQPEDVAAAAVFLASDESSWITGIDLKVDGGTTAW